jgi:hypothetical protein
MIQATGRVGGYFAQALLKTGKHNITAVIRKGSKGTVPSGAKVSEVDFDNEESVIAALTGQQFLVITLSVSAPQDLHSKIVHAAAKAGVPYIMPNSFSNDFLNESMVKEDMYSALSVAMCDDIQKSGSSFIALACGFWYQWSIALGDWTFGIDIKNKKATFLDEGNAYLPVSTWDLCGHALANLLSLPISGAEVCIDNWKNKPLFIASFHVTQRTMLDSVHRVLGDSDADWTIEHETSRARYDRAIGDLQKGDFQGWTRAMYARPFFPNGGGDFTATHTLANDALGLPKESLDEATKDAVEMVRSGWNPFA